MRKKIRVLVVDDSQSVLRKLEKLFMKMGTRVVSASNGIEALQKISESTEGFDLVFTDIEMPICDGLSLARKIRESPSLQNIPIIFNSALSNTALIREIEEEALGRYMVKFDEDLILKEVGLILERGRSAESTSPSSSTGKAA